MLRRLTAPLFALVAAAALTASAVGAGIQSPTTYRLTNNTPNTIDHVFLGFVPTGAITEPAPGESPLFLESGPSFDGVKPDFGLFNFKKTPDSPEEQALGLDFRGTGFGFLRGESPPTPTGGGLKVGESVTFKLNLNEALADQLMLTLLDPSPSSGLAFGPEPEAEPTPTPEPVPVVPTPDLEVPEPLSLLLWTTLGGLGLVRARLSRRRAGAA